MAYTPSLREIPLDEEPHASVIAAVNATQTEENDFVTQWEDLSDSVIAHLRICPACAGFVHFDPDAIHGVDIGEAQVLGLWSPKPQIFHPALMDIEDPDAQVAASITDIRNALLNEHNKLRRTYGNAPALVGHSGLHATAQNVAVHCYKKGGLYHSGQTGGLSWSRIVNAAPNHQSHGENLGRASSMNAVFYTCGGKGWRTSCGHFFNLVNKYYKRVGFGYYNGYWVAHFAGSDRPACAKNCTGSTCASHNWKSSGVWKPSC